jgi:hypothetical protein
VLVSDDTELSEDTELGEDAVDTELVDELMELGELAELGVLTSDAELTELSVMLPLIVESELRLFELDDDTMASVSLAPAIGTPEIGKPPMATAQPS